MHSTQYVCAKPGKVAHAFIPALKSLEQADLCGSKPAWSTCEFQAIQGYTMSPYLQKQKSATWGGACL